MNVAIACEQFDEHGGGLERWTAQLVNRLENRGHTIDVVCFRTGAHSLSETTRLHVLPWSDDRLRRARTAAAALRDIQADVTHDLGASGCADVVHPQAGSGRANRQRDWTSRSAPDRWKNCAAW